MSQQAPLPSTSTPAVAMPTVEQLSRTKIIMPLQGQKKCEAIRVDFQLCRRKLGFNDKECKYHLASYEACVVSQKTTWNPF